MNIPIPQTAVVLDLARILSLKFLQQIHSKAGKKSKLIIRLNSGEK